MTGLAAPTCPPKPRRRWKRRRERDGPHENTEGKPGTFRTTRFDAREEPAASKQSSGYEPEEGFNWNSLPCTQARMPRQPEKRRCAAQGNFGGAKTEREKPTEAELMRMRPMCAPRGLLKHRTALATRKKCGAGSQEAVVRSQNGQPTVRMMMVSTTMTPMIAQTINPAM